VGQIANLTGTSLIHDNIDLADLVWTGTGSASYTSNTAASGVLTVTDGNGHSEQFNLISYTGSGAFTVQNDGNGGTLVFDPPVSPTSSAIAAGSFAFLCGQAAPHHFDGLEPLPHFRFFHGPLDGITANRDLEHPRDSLFDSKADDLTNWHFSVDQNKSNLPPTSQALTHSLQGNIPTDSLGGSTPRENTGIWDHGSGDSFRFKPGLGASNPDRFPEFADAIGSEHAAIGRNADLQALVHSIHNLDVFTEAGHHENPISSVSSNPANIDHVSSYHLWA
jgi:hypothetical protein